MEGTGGPLEAGMGGSASCPEVGPGWDRLGAHEVAVDLTGHITLQAPHDLPQALLPSALRRCT
jgi:hypothetical protein